MGIKINIKIEKMHPQKKEKKKPKTQRKKIMGSLNIKNREKSENK